MITKSNEKARKSSWVSCSVCAAHEQQQQQQLRINTAHCVHTKYQNPTGHLATNSSSVVTYKKETSQRGTSIFFTEISSNTFINLPALNHRAVTFVRWMDSSVFCNVIRHFGSIDLDGALFIKQRAKERTCLPDIHIVLGRKKN